MSTRISSYIENGLAVVRQRIRATVEATRNDASVDHAGLDADAAAVFAVRDSSQLPFAWIRDRLGLTATEELAVWILLAHELDRTSRQLLRELATEREVDVTLDTLRCVVYGRQRTRAVTSELAASGRLQRWGLVQRVDGDAQRPEYRQTFAIGRRMLALALGDVELDPALKDVASAGRSIGTAGLVVPEEAERALAEAIATCGGLIAVIGKPGTGRRSLLTALANNAGHEVLNVDCCALSTKSEACRAQLAVIERECLLMRRRPLLANLEALSARADVPDRLDLVESELAGLVLATATHRLTRRWNCPPLMVSLAPPSGEQRVALWSRAIPEAAEGDHEIMATMYPMAPALIHAAGEAAHRHAGGRALSAEHIAIGVRAVLDDRLAGLASRIETTQTWNDLVVPNDQATQLGELIARIRQRRTVYEKWGFGDKVGRGLGVVALFSGPPGTGKTMAAGLVARDLGAELYQVDLSKIVSKWIGETERNLAALFDAAEAGHAILLFDEADALFGKRTQVTSSNDRHANQEVNYLLQRIESFTGVCLLTTNFEASLDDAFKRRIAVHVKFPMPEVDERRHLWRVLLPREVPVQGELDTDSLADRFEMSGGYIRNAMLRAVFVAADTTGLLDATMLANAAQLEYESMGKLPPGARTTHYGNALQ